MTVSPGRTMTPPRARGEATLNAPVRVRGNCRRGATSPGLPRGPRPARRSGSSPAAERSLRRRTCARRDAQGVWRPGVGEERSGTRRRQPTGPLPIRIATMMRGACRSNTTGADAGPKTSRSAATTSSRHGETTNHHGRLRRDDEHDQRGDHPHTQPPIPGQQHRCHDLPPDVLTRASHCTVSASPKWETGRGTGVRTRCRG